jgi:RNA polymerase sigma-70 factor (ECF subfamily)
MVRTSPSLLQRLSAAADDAAWQRFVEIYGPLIYGWMRRFGLQDHDARDLAQDVLLSIVRAMPSFQYDPQRGTFRAWLRTMVLNRLRGYWRKRHTNIAMNQLEQQLDELADPHSALSNRWNDEYKKGVFSRALDLLRPEFEPSTWQAFWRVSILGDTPAVAAESLGLSVNAVYLAKSRILRRLRQECEDLLD